MNSTEEMKSRDDLREALSSKACRRVLQRVLNQSRPLAPSYAPTDPLATAYNEGLRALGLWFLTEVEKAAPGQGVELLQQPTAAAQTQTYGGK